MRPSRPSLTARWIAAHRAGQAHSRLSTATGDPAAEARLYRNLRWFFIAPGTRPDSMDLRTHFMDNEVAGALGAGAAQIVIVGAGYDGRALRFGGGPTRWFEVDFPATQADKRRRLDRLGIATDAVTYIGLDLITDDLGAALAAAGHDDSARSLFLCEGLLSYLPLAATATLFETLRARAAPGSTLAVNVRVHRSAGARLHTVRQLVNGLLAAIGEKRRMLFHPGDIEKLLTITGWQMMRSERSVQDRMNDGSHLLVLAAEPAQAVP
jgi:methyltransferase (TIGR00027 family)